MGPGAKTGGLSGTGSFAEKRWPVARDTRQLKTMSRYPFLIIFREVSRIVLLLVEGTECEFQISLSGGSWVQKPDYSDMPGTLVNGLKNRQFLS
jgi:hypothetical protein